MIDARKFTNPEMIKAYNRRSWVYSKTVAKKEHNNHLLAIEQADIQPGNKVLEVAVGPGLTLVDLARKAGKDSMIYGVDISTGMLELASKKMMSEGFDNFELREADCRHLPFEDNTFDVLYNGYMLDLIELSDLPLVINEFKRVLKPGGWLVLLNKSKKDEKGNLIEKLYQKLPAGFVLYIFGACRPVLMEDIVVKAGFTQVSRTFIPEAFASEIVLATKKW